MKLRRNAAAKLVTVIASLSALGGLWALIQTNAPASANTPAPVPNATATPPLARTSTAVARPAMARNTHTRTRVS